MPPVSVVIPTHLRPHLLTDAIASVVAQTVSPAELIVVDDADDAATRAVADAAVAGCGFPIRYVRNLDGGVCRSRNLGAARATADHVGFLDDDDVWAPDFLKLVVPAFAQPSVDLAIAGIVRYEYSEPPRLRVQRDDLNASNVLAEPGSMTGSNFVVARAVFDSVGGFDPEMTVFNDWDLFVRLIDAGIDYAVVPQPLVEWREHSGVRIASFTLRRADGLDRFIARYHKRLSPRLIRDFRTTAIGIRRRYADSVGQRLTLSLQLAAAHGIGGIVRKLASH